MQTDKIRIRNLEVGRDEALEEAEKFSAYVEHDHKNAMRMRLLVEETLGMVGAIAEDFWADFWMEGKKHGKCQIHVVVHTEMDMAKKQELIDASKNKRNDAYKGFTGKIREFIDNSFTMAEEAAIMDGVGYNGANCFVMGMIDMPIGLGAPVVMDGVTWSLDAYRQGVEGAKGSDREAEEAWDELEKSILAKLADDLRVSIKGNVAEIVVEKRFD